MRIKEGFVLREMCGEYVVTGESLEYINFNRLLSLNKTAAYLWRELQGKDFDAETMAALLVQHYEVDHTQALADARTLCEQWLKAGVAV